MEMITSVEAELKLSVGRSDAVEDRGTADEDDCAFAITAPKASKSIDSFHCILCGFSFYRRITRERSSKGYRYKE